jgi:EmrB/QacA subfamily drug resistance transporter
VVDELNAGSAGWREALTREVPRPRAIREWPHNGWLAVGAVCFGAFMGQLDASIVTLAYAPLRSEFGVSSGAVQWVSLSYLVALAVALVPLGRVADSHGRKLTYVYGFAVFTLASLACALAPNMPALVGMRLVQGIGAALLQSTSIALVTASAPPGRARSALGMQAGAQALGLALGPTVGGVLVVNWGWRSVFAVNVPVGIVAITLALVALPRTRDAAQRRPMDHLGLFALAIAVTSALLALSAAADLPLPMAVTISLGVLAVAATATLVRSLRTARHPLVDPGLLARRSIRNGLIGALCSYLLLFAPLVLIPSWLTGHGLSADRAGFVLTALPAGFALMATVGGHLIPSGVSDRVRLTTGSVATTIGVIGLLVIPARPPAVAVDLAVLGLALGLFTPANNAAVMAHVGPSARATIGGTLSMARSLGTAAGVAVVTVGLAHGLAGLDTRQVAVVLLIPIALVMVLVSRAADGSTGAPTEAGL